MKKPNPPPGKKPNLKKASPARKSTGQSMAKMMAARAMTGGGMPSQMGTSSTIGGMV